MSGSIMMLHSALATVLLLPYIAANVLNQTAAPSSIKIKRTTYNDQIYGHGDAKAVLFYMENPRQVEPPELQGSASTQQGLKNFYAAPSKPLALVSVQQPIQVFEQDNPKQVAEQQVLYEFQQTPTNAVSNVHVKQLFQPSNMDMTNSSPTIQGQATDLFPAAQPIAPGYMTSPNFQTRQQKSFAPQGTTGSGSAATIVSPVHHSVYTNHHAPGSSSQSSFNPFLPADTHHQRQFQGANKAPGKYIYLNGKIVYNPVHIVPQSKLTPNSVYHKGVYHNQQKLPLLNNHFKVGAGLPPQSQQLPFAVNRDFNAGNHGGALDKLPPEQLTPPAYLPPITKQNAGFKAPKKLQPIDKPSSHPIQQEVEEKEEEEEEENQEDEKEDEEDRPEEGEAADREEDGDDAASENEEEERDHSASYADDETYGYERFPFEGDDGDRYFKATKYKKTRYREEEDDEDDEPEEQPSSRHDRHQRRHRSSPKRDDSFGFREGYSSNSKYNYAKKNGKLVKGGKPSGKFKKVKHSRVGQGKPRVEVVEGKSSENIPVTHKAKIYKERWYVSKDIEGDLARKPKTMK